MPTTTTNYSLIKPIEASEFVDVDQLNTNMDTIDTNLKRVDTEAHRVGRLVASIFDGTVGNPGDVVVATTPVIAATSTSRRYRITCRAQGRCASGTLSTGHTFTIQRELNGSGTWNQAGDAFVKIYPSTGTDDGVFFEVWDDGVTAGNTARYRVRVQGYGINGNGFANTRVGVWDAGIQ